MKDKLHRAQKTIGVLIEQMSKYKETVSREMKEYEDLLLQVNPQLGS